MKERKCHICNKQLNGGKHIYYCDNSIKSKEEIKKRFIEYNFPVISKKSILKNEYVDNLLSLPDLKKKYNIDYKSVFFLLDFYGIKKRGASESAKKISQSKYKKTCIEKYGVENVSQLDDIKEKKAKTFLKNYGVDNIRKSEEFKEWLKKYMNETYGAGSLPNSQGNADYWGWKKLSTKEKNKRVKKLHMHYDSYPERAVQESLIELNQKFHTQFFVDNRSFDLKICGKKLLIEVNGNYWHANPKMYKPNDLLIFKGEKVYAKEVWEKDLAKKHQAEKLGYEVEYIWEDEIKENSSNELRETVLKILKKHNC